MLRILSLLIGASITGVLLSTTGLCYLSVAIHLVFSTTAASCALGEEWFIGVPVAIVSAFGLGLPVAYLFRRLGFVRWWQHLIGGTLTASLFVIFAAILATEDSTITWFLYLAPRILISGAIAGVMYWWLSNRSRANPSVKRDGLPAAPYL